IDGRGAHLVDRLRFGAGDLVFGELGAPLQRVLQGRPRLVRKGLGLASRLIDDGLGFLADVAVPLLVVGEQGLRLLAQAAGLVQLLADRVGPVVERLGEKLRHLVVDEDRQEGDERDRDPELSHPEHRRPGSYSAARCTSAFFTSSLLTSLPMSRETMAPATSPAMSPTLASALVLVSAM